MAGLKETPRQKLIGLMYLVLLAMLALQVSSAIIQKFQFLNDSIELSNKDKKKDNSEIIDRIAGAVEKNKNNPKDLKTLENSKVFHTKTQDLLSFISALKKELIQKSGGEKDKTGAYPGAKKEEPVAQLMIGSGETKSGKGYELKRRLNTYSSFSTSFAKKSSLEKEFDLLAKDGDQDPIFKEDASQRNKDFSHLNFESTPLVAALAVLSEKEAQILAIESQVLNGMARKVGIEKIPVDRIRPVVSTAANYVVAGMPYEAEMFMAAYSSTHKPQMTFKGDSISIDNEGVGSVKFRAGASNYNSNGLSKQTWSGTIRFPKANGEDSIYTITKDYYVVKPVIQVQSSSVQRLYKNCANKLTVSVPALGAQYQPSYQVDGGTFVKGAGNLITIIPRNRRVRVKVKSNGVPVGELNFDVNRVPSATFTTNHDVKRGATCNGLANTRLLLKAPTEFKELLPEESKYRADVVDVFLSRRGRLVQQVSVSGGRNVNLSSLRAACRPGDAVVFEVKRATRTNYRGNKEVASVNNPIISIPIRE